MASDLFHEAARAYFGVSPELHALANIATHGNAPASYAMGGKSSSPDQDADDAPADEEDEEESPTRGKYVKPELPPIARQPRSSRGQKGLFKDIPIDYSLTGTGGHVTGDEEDYGLMDALGFGKKPPAPRPPAAPVSRAQVQAAASKLTPKPAAAAPSSRSQVQAAADKLRKGLPVIKDVMTDYSLTGTGTKVKVPESKNCAKSGCGMKAK